MRGPQRRRRLIVEGPQDDRRIAAATAEAGPDRYGFMELDRKAGKGEMPSLLSIGIPEQFRRPLYQIGFICGNTRCIACQPNVVPRIGQHDAITEIDAGHERGQFMIAVRTPPGYRQEQIDFRRGQEIKRQIGHYHENPATGATNNRVPG